MPHSTFLTEDPAALLMYIHWKTCLISALNHHDSFTATLSDGFYSLPAHPVAF